MWLSGGKLILDFHGNLNIKEKRHQMEALLSDLRKHYNVSATEIADFDDLERCVIGLALAAGTEQGARSAMKKVIEYIDSTSFARLIVEDTDFFGYD
jgi:uncharacterized protein YlxP (DUF503 family)